MDGWSSFRHGFNLSIMKFEVLTSINNCTGFLSMYATLASRDVVSSASPVSLDFKRYVI